MTINAISIDKSAYRNIIEYLIEEHAHAVEADAFGVATTMILSPEIVDGELTRTHGSGEYMHVSLYPLDVFAHTEQTAERIDEHDGRAEHSDMLTAHVAFELDLLDALEQKHPDANNNNQ